MNKATRENSETNDTQKMSELVFKTKMTVAILTILACIAVMLSTAFALFSSTTGYSAKLESAVWRVLVEADGGFVNGSYTCSQAENGSDSYFFTISPSGTKGASGYCVITITDPDGNPTIYNTAKFSSDIEVNITAADGCTISFAPHWGDPVNFGAANILRGNAIFHSVTPVVEEEQEEASSEEAEDEITSEDNGDSSEGDGDASDAITDISSSLSDIFDIFGGGGSGGGTSTPSGDGNNSEDTSAPSGDGNSSGGTSAPSGGGDGGSSSSAPSGNSGSVDVAPPPSSSLGGGEGSSSSGGSDGGSSSSSSGGSDGGSSSSSSGGSDGGSSSSSSGDGE